MAVKFFPYQKDLRQWFEKNHKKSDELWIAYYKKGTGKVSIDWPQSVDEALCFGWIDGIRKRIDDESYKIRFTPRRKKSHWSSVNLKRIEELISLDLVHSTGLEVYNKRDIKNIEKTSYEKGKISFEPSYETIIKKDIKAWTYFEKLSPYIKKTSIHWIMSAKKKETQLKRLNILIDSSREGLVIPPLRRK